MVEMIGQISVDIKCKLLQNGLSYRLQILTRMFLRTVQTRPFKTVRCQSDAPPEILGVLHYYKFSHSVRMQTNLYIKMTSQYCLSHGGYRVRLS